MGPVTAVSRFFTHYFDFYGRARRFEYGWVLMMHLGVNVFGSLLFINSVGTDFDFDVDPLGPVSGGLAFALGVFGIGTIIPWISLSIRRFHDMNYSGWMAALFMGLWLIPPIGFIGAIVQFFWMLLGGGTAGVNKYGEDPRFQPFIEFG